MGLKKFLLETQTVQRMASIVPMGSSGSALGAAPCGSGGGEGNDLGQEVLGSGVVWGR